MGFAVADIVTSVASQAGLDAGTAEKVVGTILSIFAHEAEGTHIAGLMSNLQGAPELASSYDVMAAGGAGAGGGFFASIATSVLGAKAGPLLNGIAQLKSYGLGVGQIEQAGQAFVQEAKAVIGPDKMNQILASVPGLASHIGV